MQLGLSDKVAIVTGGSGGLGTAVVRTLAREGAAVMVSDLDDTNGERLAESVRCAGDRAAFVHLDVTIEDQWRRAVEEASRHFGGVHVLINAAGLNSVGDAVEETMEGFMKIVAVNEVGVWLGMKYCVPAMREAGGGAIVNVGSVCGVVAGMGRAIGYHATKAAIRGMTRNSALRFAPDGIRVNSIHPGPINTPMQEKDRGTEFERGQRNATALKRYAEPQEIANVIAFLASDCASYMTGAEVFVDGGWTAI